MSNALKSTRACHELVHSFLGSSPEDCLNSLSTNLDNIDRSVILSHEKLHLPTLYPSSFDESLHASTKAQVLRSYNDMMYILHKWGLEKLSISYNGGKDCLVQLIIYLAAIYQFMVVEKQYDQTLGTPKIHINAVYVHTENEFIEQVRFLESSVLQYGLDFMAVYTSFTQKDSETMDSASSQLLKESSPSSCSSMGRIKCLFSPTQSLPCGFLTYLKSNKCVEAIIVGIRRTDPYGSLLKLEQRTDTNRGWPDFMRINPVLEWHTREVWYFIKWLENASASSDFAINYCCLYDRGYTSLGGCDNTVRNPQLKRKYPEGDQFWPAWWVLEDDVERLSRVQKGKV